VSTQGFLGNGTELTKKVSNIQVPDTGLDLSTTLRLCTLSVYNLSCRDVVECYSRVFQLVAYCDMVKAG
jgi:hypothetical protein